MRSVVSPPGSRLLFALAALAAVTVSSAPACAQGAAVAGSPERGYRLYVEKMCFTCHGTVGQGGERGSGPQIAPNPWPYEAFVNQVRHPRQDMPRYAAKFVGDDDLRDIHAYLSSIKAGRASRDIELLK